MGKRGLVLFLLVALWLTGSASGELIGWWTFEDPANLGVDSSGKGNHGTTEGDATFSPNAFQGSGALLLDGTDDFIKVGLGKDNMLADWTSNLTIAAWIKPDDLRRPWNCFFGHTTENNGVKFELMSGNFRFTTLGVMDYDQPVSLTAGDWAHVALTFNQAGNLAIFYANGQKVGEISGGSPANKATGNYNVGYGGYWAEEQFQGLLDDVRIYHNVLTAAEIKQLAFRPKAYNPTPANGATGVSQGLFQWKPGSSATFHSVYLGTNPELAQADLVANRQPFAMYFHIAGVQAGITYYWRVDEVETTGTTYTGDVWSFSVAPATAYASSPRNGDKWVATDATLTWQAGLGAVSHEAYFGTDKDAIANRAADTFKGKLLATSYAPGALSQNTVYYWAVDETNMTGTKYAGDVWSFTTIGPGGGVKGEYFNGMTPLGDAALSRIDPAIDFSWGDPGGPGAPIGVDNFSARWTADLEIAVADTYTFITSTDDGVRLWLNEERIIDQWVDQGTTDVLSRPMALKPGIYSLRMEYYENTGGAVARLSWQTPTMARQVIPGGPLQPPVRARALYPVNGDANIPQDVILTWGAGGQAVRHQVYFGEDAEAVANAAPDSTDIYKGEQTLEETSFSPGTLEWNKTYYWRVDEVNDASADSPWKGAVWSFTTADFLVVDDFESYNDQADQGTRLYETWLDGVTNGTTSTVGNWDPPFAEQTIVHGRRQSMPMDYNNINSPYYAEAEREFSPVQNWKANEVDALVLYVRGQTSNGAGTLYVVVEDSAGKTGVVVNPDAGAVNATTWTQWKIPLSDLAGVNLAKVKKLYLGVGDRENPVAGGGGRIYIDDIRVVKPALAGQ